MSTREVICTESLSAPSKPPPHSTAGAERAESKVRRGLEARSPGGEMPTQVQSPLDCAYHAAGVS